MKIILSFLPRKILSWFCLILFINPVNLYANGGLMLTPNRLEFNDQITNQEVRLINRSDNPVSYRISLQHLRMDEKGNYSEISEKELNPPEKFADNLLRFSPRRVTLQPNEIQTVRVVIRKPDNLESGEYRSHLLFREELDANFKTERDVEAKKAKSSNKISIILKPLFGISIPVIITNGATQFESMIQNLAIKTDHKNSGNKILSLEIARSGNASAYGNIIVSFKPNQSDQEYEVGTLNSIAVFYPYHKRALNIKLKAPENIKLLDGILTVKYISKPNDSEGSKNRKILAQSSLPI